MLCPACGYEEPEDSICSKCHTRLAVKTNNSETHPSSSAIPPTPSMGLEGKPQEEKYRRKPLMDLDLTIPELEADEKKQPNILKKDQKP
jgi:hypothetical protein